MIYRAVGNGNARFLRRLIDELFGNKRVERLSALVDGQHPARLLFVHADARFKLLDGNRFAFVELYNRKHLQIRLRENGRGRNHQHATEDGKTVYFHCI